MTRKTRRTIFLFFLLMFVILVPIIVLYAEGYSLDLEKRLIFTSGGIYVSSLPSRAEIYVSNKLVGKTSKFIRRLTPKDYEIKIIKEDYHPWEKRIIVKPGLVTKLEDIFLIPLNPKIELVATESREYLNFTNNYPFPVSQILDLIKKKSKNKISEINYLNLDAKKENLYFLFKKNLYALKIDKAIPNNSVLSDVLKNNVINYTLYKDGILYLDYATEKIYELDLTSLRSVEFFNQVFPGFGQGRWIISSDDKKILCLKENSMEVLWLETINNAITQKKGDIEKIDFNQKINDAIWYPKTNENLIIATDDTIFVSELDSRLPRNTIKFIATEKPQIKYDANNKILYFLSRERLYKTEI